MPAALRDGLGVFISYVFVFGFIGLATVLMRQGALNAAAARKVIHIGVSHWWLIAMAMIDDPWVASVGPASFIIINALAIRFRFLPAMGEGAPARNWGTVYFPVSLLVLVNLCWRGLLPLWAGAIAVLVMGWGDGLAAMVGEGSRRAVRFWGGRKSLAGTAVMFAASFTVAMVFTLLFNRRMATPGQALGAASATAAVATAVEFLTPLGIDNITVPLATAAVYGLFV
jgi:phytol kinase